MAAGAAAEASPSVEEIESMPKVALTIIESAKISQLQNGLRHDDFGGYRQYCARRLRRIRVLKHVRFLHSKSKSKHEFVPKEMTAGDVTSSEHLLLLLYNAERAWSHAMELKQAVDDVVARGEGSVRPHHHRLRRLRKAAGWAEKLREMATARGDSRTILEAEAYAAAMQAQLLGEEFEWEFAAVQAATARAAIISLARTAPVRSRRMLEERERELRPVERFAKYQLRAAGGADAVTAAKEASLAAVAELAPIIAAVNAAAATDLSVDTDVAAGLATTTATTTTAAADDDSGFPVQESDALLPAVLIASGRMRWCGRVVTASEGSSAHKAMQSLAGKLREEAETAQTGSAEEAEEAALAVLSSLDTVSQTASQEARKLRRNRDLDEADEADSLAAAASWHRLRRFAQRAGRDASGALSAATLAMGPGMTTSIAANPTPAATQEAITKAASAGQTCCDAAALVVSAPGGEGVIPVVRATVALSVAGSGPPQATVTEEDDDDELRCAAGGWWEGRVAGCSGMRNTVGLLDRALRACDELEAAFGSASMPEDGTEDPGASSAAAAKAVIESSFPEAQVSRALRVELSALRALALGNWYALSGEPARAAALLGRASSIVVHAGLVSWLSFGADGAAVIDASAARADDAWPSNPAAAEATARCVAVAAAASAGHTRCNAAAVAHAAGGDAGGSMSAILGAKSGRGAAAATEALVPAVAAMEIGGPVMLGNAPLAQLPGLPQWVGLKQLHFDVAYGMLEPPSLAGRFARKAPKPPASTTASTTAAAPASTPASPPHAPATVATPADDTPTDPAPAPAADDGVLNSLFRMFSG